MDDVTVLGYIAWMLLFIVVMALPVACWIDSLMDRSEST